MQRFTVSNIVLPFGLGGKFSRVFAWTLRPILELMECQKDRSLGEASAGPETVTHLKKSGPSQGVPDFEEEPPPTKTTISEPLGEFGPYTLIRVLGEGGMGIVYEVVNNNFPRVEALKMIRPEYAANPNSRWRLKNEAWALSRLSHPNIIRVNHIDEYKDQLFFTMDYIDGVPLSALLGSTEVDNRWRISRLAKVARALDHAHALGIVHRDIKPHNMMVDSQGKIYLGDFGIAKCLAREDGPTLPGDILGTLDYLAPEAALGFSKDMGPEADVYSLGATLNHALTGIPPFRGRNHRETLWMIKHHKPIRPRQLNGEIDQEIEEMIMKSLQKDPTKRPTALAFAEGLESWLKKTEVPAKRSLTQRSINFVRSWML